LELNPDVRGEGVNQNPAQLIENNPEFFQKFDLIISNDLSEVQENIFIHYQYRVILERLERFVLNGIFLLLF
jgi:hypothetical protein